MHQLRTLVAVIEHGSVSAAARQLALTPSTLSAHVTALEKEFGIVLFERSHTGVTLTDTGRCLEPYARQTLQAASDFANEADSRRARIAGRLSLACSVDESSFGLAQIVARLGQANPDIQLRLSRGESARIVEQIRNQEADLGIIYGDIDASDICAHHLGQAELTIALPASWLSASADTLEIISRRPWIQTGEDCPFQRLSRRFFAARKIDPPILMRVDDNRTRRQLVISGMGISLLDRHEANHPAIASLATEPLRCDLTLAYLAHRQFQPIIQAARDLILQAV